MARDEIKLSLIEMDGKHETYGELHVTASDTMVRIGIRSSLAEGAKRPEYVAHLGAGDALRLASWILSAGISLLDQECEQHPVDDE